MGVKAGGRHTNLHAGVKGSVHFGFDVDNLPDAEKQKEEKARGGYGGYPAHAPALSTSTPSRCGIPDRCPLW